jgi:hypothetical protein
MRMSGRRLRGYWEVSSDAPPETQNLAAVTAEAVETQPAISDLDA